MHVTYDPVADMAYIYLADIAPGGVRTSVVIEDQELRGDLVIDLDADGRILGVEVFRPREQLPAPLLAAARRP